MKQKLYIYVTNAEQVVTGDKPHLHADTYNDLKIDGWILAGETDVSVEINLDDIRDSAVKNIDEEESKLRAQLHACETRKANLLAITHQPVTDDIGDEG